MPNGGSDNCETCWFNSRHEGKAGYGDGLPCRCVIRGLEIRDTYHTYCANHPHHNPDKVATPVGSVYVHGEDRARVAWAPSPDNEEVRRSLLALLEGLSDAAPSEYASPTRFEWEVVSQLGLFREKRALAGLRRVLSFAPL